MPNGIFNKSGVLIRRGFGQKFIDILRSSQIRDVEEIYMAMDQGVKSKMNPVGLFEMPGEDIDRMRKFYEDVFNWKTHQLSKEMGGYVVVTTTETENYKVKPPGTINGGFYKKTDNSLSQYPSIVIFVEDIHEAMKKVRESGGQVIGGKTKKGEPEDIPGVGLFSVIIDTEGNRISLLQSKMRGR